MVKKIPKVSIVECKTYNQKEVDFVVKKAFDMIGGLEKYVKPSDKVLIKPNLILPLKPQRSATTHPSVVSSLCKELSRIGCEIWIGDSSAVESFGKTKAAINITGMQEVANKYSAKIMSLDSTGSVTIKNENARVLREIQIAKAVVDADIIISVPKMKTHIFTLYTGAVKNLMGTVPGYNKAKIHELANDLNSFSDAMADLYETVKPHLGLMDGIIGMEGNGPTAGNPRKAGMIVASNNLVALDIVVSEIMGFRHDEIMTNKKLIERKVINPSSIIVYGRRSIVKFKRPSTWTKILVGNNLAALYHKNLRTEPRINKDKCKKCFICKDHCPVSAIDTNLGIDSSRCILCYCCHEICPENAIVLQKTFLASTLKHIFKRLKFWRTE